jgi:hypothetical protein
MRTALRSRRSLASSFPVWLYLEKRPGWEARNFLRRKMTARWQPFRATPKAQRGRMAA